MTTLLTASQLSKQLNISTDTIYSLARRGLIPSQKIGKHIRFDLAQVLEATKRHAPIKIQQHIRTVEPLHHDSVRSAR